MRFFFGSEEVIFFFFFLDEVLWYVHVTQKSSLRPIVCNLWPLNFIKLWADRLLPTNKKTLVPKKLHSVSKEPLKYHRA